MGLAQARPEMQGIVGRAYMPLPRSLDLLITPNAVYMCNTHVSTAFGVIMSVHSCSLASLQPAHDLSLAPGSTPTTAA